MITFYYHENSYSIQYDFLLIFESNKQNNKKKR